MKSLNRRRFVQLVMGGLTLSILNNCGATSPQPSATPNSPATSLPPRSTPTPAKVILRNENTPGFFVRYYQPFEAPDPEKWTLIVEGLVGQRQVLRLQDVLALDRVTQVSRMKCVECWSAAAKWEGFHLRSLLEIVQPKPEAKWLNLYCADGYYESLNLVTLQAERVLFVHHMNDEILPPAYGAPLRLMVPFRYGYKSAKALIRLEFAAEEGAGYWSTVAPYTTHGNIRRGTDHPLDLEGTRKIAGGQEIFYPDGIESP